MSEYFLVLHWIKMSTRLVISDFPTGKRALSELVVILPLRKHCLLRLEFRTRRMLCFEPSDTSFGTPCREQ